MFRDEAVLLQRFVATGDAGAFSEIVRRYASLVYSACLRILGDTETAADATQETFFQFLKNANTITGSIPAWLHRVATCKAVDRIRAESARRRAEDQYAEVKCRQIDKWEELSPYVDEALDALDAPSRELLIEYFLKGRSLTDIAAEKGISHPTVSRHVKASVSKLRGQLRKSGIGVAAAAFVSLLGGNAAQAAPATVLQELGKIALVGSEAAGAATAGTAAASTSGAGAAASGTGAKVAGGVLAGVKAKVATAAAIAIVGVGSVVTYNYVTESPAPKQPANPVVRQSAASVSQSPPAPVTASQLDSETPTAQEIDWSQLEGQMWEQIFAEHASDAPPTKPVPTASRSEESVAKVPRIGPPTRGAEEANEEMDSQQHETGTVTVEVKNSNGSSSLVKLKKDGAGYVDPRGTYFDHLPTGEELHPVYGF